MLFSEIRPEFLIMQFLKGGTLLYLDLKVIFEGHLTQSERGMRFVQNKRFSQIF